VSASNQRFAYLIEKIKLHGEAKTVLESTGNFWLKSYEALEAANIHISLSDPLRTEAIAEAASKPTK